MYSNRTDKYPNITVKHFNETVKHLIKIIKQSHKLCAISQLFNLATPCMQYFNFNGLVARFLMFASMYKIKNGSLLGQMDEAYWVSGSSGSLIVYISVTRLHAEMKSITLASVG